MQARMEKQKAEENQRRRKQYEQGEQRTEDRAFYSSKRWMRFRKHLLSKPEFALCVECKKEGLLVATNQIDHVLPRKTHPELTWEESNLQGLCRRHHGKKTLSGR